MFEDFWGWGVGCVGSLFCFVVAVDDNDNAGFLLFVCLVNCLFRRISYAKIHVEMSSLDVWQFLPVYLCFLLCSVYLAVCKKWGRGSEGEGERSVGCLMDIRCPSHLSVQSLGLTAVGL